MQALTEECWTHSVEKGYDESRILTVFPKTALLGNALLRVHIRIKNVSRFGKYARHSSCFNTT